MTYNAVTGPRSVRSVIEGLEPRVLFAAGDYDPTFGHSGLVLDYGPGRLVDMEARNGKVVLLLAGDGASPWLPEKYKTGVGYARYDADGTRDDDFLTEYGKQAGLERFGSAVGLAIQADGRIVVAGALRDGTPGVWRLNAADGSLDRSFGVNGFCKLPVLSPTAPSLAPDGKIVVGGVDPKSYAIAAARLTAGGRVDGAFGTNGVAASDESNGNGAESVMALPDGRVLVGGSARDPNSDPHATVVRFSNSGRYEGPVFYDYPFVYQSVSAMSAGPDGSMYYAIEAGGGTHAGYVVRVGADGAYTRFAAVSSSADFDLTSVHLTPDGQRVVAFGNYLGYDFSASSAALRWNLDGTFDRSFDGDGILKGYGLDFGVVLPDGRALAAGDVDGTTHLSRRLGDADAFRAGVSNDEDGFDYPPGTLWVEGARHGETIRVTGVPAAGKTPAKIRVECRRPGAAPVVRLFDRAGIFRLSVDGNGGDDDISVDAFGLPAEILGGAGSDRLTGGRGKDDLDGGTGNDRMFGAAGDDRLLGGPGDDVLDGGTGADFIHGGTPDGYGGLAPDGVDTVTYAARIRPVRVTLGDSYNPDDPNTPVANDGEAGERDVVDAVRVVVGGRGNDELRVVSTAIDGYVDGRTRYVGVTLIGGPGDDRLYGGSGADSLIGGAGRDRLFGLAGNDRLFARDGERDEIDGGDGFDRAASDADDVLRSIEARE